MVTSLGWDTLVRRRENHIVKLVEKCPKRMVPSYFSKYFQLKRHDIHDYDIRKKNKLVLDRVKLESTKRAFLSYFFKKITLSRRAGPCSQWSMFVSHTNQV